MSNVLRVDDLKARRNGSMARPNIRYRDLPARQQTDGFLLAAAGLDTDRPKIAWWRKLKVWELGLLILGVIGLVVMVLSGSY